MEVSDLSEHDWLSDPDWPRVVTAAEWKHGLPPPVEALQEEFPPESGWEIHYETWIEPNRSIPVATVRHPELGSTTFFPQAPSSARSRREAPDG